MEQNKIRTYIFYALGEIILVVIGILIALQVNNWNEERKQIATETQFLHELSSNLNASKAELEYAIHFNENTLQNLQTIRRYVEQDLPQDSVVTSAFSTFENWTVPYFTFSAYESMKSRGLFNFDNDQLKPAIIKMYEEHFPYFKEDYDRAEWQFSAELRVPIIKKYLRYNEDESVSILNYDRMISVRHWGIVTSHTAIENIDALQAMISEELEARS